jgi:hypothetical protein
MKRPKQEQQESYSEGNLDEATIAYFLRHLDNFDVCHTVKHKMKVVMIELISNIITHARSSYGSVSIKHTANHFIIKTSNYSSFQNINKTIALANDIRNAENLSAHYLNQLSEVSYEKRVSLGLIEIFRLSNGKINITGGLVDDQPAIHFEIQLEDGKEEHTTETH